MRRRYGEKNDLIEGRYEFGVGIEGGLDDFLERLVNLRGNNIMMNGTIDNSKAFKMEPSVASRRKAEKHPPRAFLPPSLKATENRQKRKGNRENGGSEVPSPSFLAGFSSSMSSAPAFFRPGFRELSLASSNSASS